MSNITLYRHPLSGHAHRVELLLSLLAIDAELVTVDLMTGEQKTPEFLKKNSAGQVPVLDDNGRLQTDSNAILVYLATAYDTARTWLPEDASGAAEVQRFLTAAAGPVASGPATARLVTLFGAGLDHAKAIDTAHNTLAKFEAHLETREWLVGNDPTIADVANYAYIAHAPEGNVSLDDYPHVKAWLLRIETLPGFIPMQSSAVGLCAK